MVELRALFPAALGAFLVSYASLHILLSRFGRFALDRPNERSMHTQPVPRTGGIAILAGSAVALAFGTFELWIPMVLGLALALLSFADDVFGLPAWARLLVHVAICAVLVWSVPDRLPPIGFAVLTLGLAWLTNLYNFMDGSDGLAGGMTAIGFGAYALAAAISGGTALAVLSAAIAAAALAFLRFNFYPARIFMGDVGSIPVGFLAGALGLIGWHEHRWPLWFPVVVFAPFVIDASLTLLRRLVRMERIWQAHREHYYQRVVRMGFGQRGMALAEYGLMMACAALAIAARGAPTPLQFAILLVAGVLLVPVAVLIDLRWARQHSYAAHSGFSNRALVAFAHDVAAALITWWLAFWLRFNLEIPPTYAHLMLSTTPWVVVICAALFMAFGLYRGLWRYASLPDLRRILVTVGLCALAIPLALKLRGQLYGVPRSVYLISPLLLASTMSGSRLMYRVWKEGLIREGNARATRVLVLGAGSAGLALLKDLSMRSDFRAVGVLDDDVSKHGGEILGIKVYGAFDSVDAVAQRLGVEQAIIAIPGASHAARKRAVELCTRAKLRVMTVPAYGDIVSGKVSVSALRAVELDDLLGRDPVQLDTAGLQAFLHDASVLVTGAGGSIGSELCRQIARHAPRCLVLFDVSEYALYTIEQEFRDRHPELNVVALVGDAKDPQRVREVFARLRPRVVFHAAAYKHVPLMEEQNAFQAVANNVGSTIVVARAAEEFGAEKFVLISSDKAVNPTNVMGASKRLSEIACQALQEQSRVQFVIVRFGNVLGSTGSVIPRFREQIARGGPVTVTHPEILRYFMSIPEAAQLVLQAGLMGKSGEIFVLDMGEPVRIADLARQLIRLSGFSESDIKIEYTGLRPGEKLYEELLADAEKTLPTPHPKLRVARAHVAEGGRRLGDIEVWLRAPEAMDAASVRMRLRQFIPEYRTQARSEPSRSAAHQSV